MKVLCSACSHEHDVSPAELSLGSSCVRCGQNLGKGTLDDGAQLELGSTPGAAHSIPSRARDDLRAATKDLFGSIEPPKPSSPALARPPAPEPPPPAPAMTSNENSIMFSLESLMKARGAATPAAPQVDQVSEQHLWDMTGAAPLFGTAHDQALLTTPLQQPAPPVHVMTLPSRPPRRRGRWKWIASGVGVCGMAFAGWWLSSGSTVQATVPSSEPVAQQAPPAPAAPEGAKSEATAAEAAVVPATVVPAVAQGAVAQGEGIDPNAAESAAGSADPAAPGEQPAAVASDAPPAASDAVTPGSEPSGPRAAEDSSKKSENKKSARPTKKVASTAAPPKPKGPGLPFNVGAAKDALGSASTKAAACGRSGPGGTGKIQVTFAPNGKVSNASLTSGSFSGATQSCILRAFRAARVPAFAGNAVTVAKSFKL